MLLKLLAFNKGYFLSGWNIFDFFVVMASVLDIILTYTKVKSDQSSALSILPKRRKPRLNPLQAYYHEYFNLFYVTNHSKIYPIAFAYK